jgi:serine/threonine-protein kinase
MGLDVTAGTAVTETAGLETVSPAAADGPGVIGPYHLLQVLFEGGMGIAKATRQGSVAHAAFTQLGMLIGTPEYISPEQAQASGLEMDTTTDIYSLSVVLYELLTGVLPFDSETLRRAGYAEMYRILREQDPPKPSLRVTALGAAAAEVARQHQTALPALGKQLRGDLDAIAMKAMEKDRTRRYPSASSTG